jgi:hypothetical protein
MIHGMTFFFSIVKASYSRLSGNASIALAGSLRVLATLALACVVFFSPATAQNPATSVAVDANANQHTINPNIYGGAWFATSDLIATNAPLNRLGGNNTSDYNWQQDAMNLDEDWYWESYLEDGPPVVPGAMIDNEIQSTHAANVGSQPMVTIPMLPYIAKAGADANSGAASLWSFSVAKYGAQVGCGSLASADPYQSDAGSGCLSGGGFVVNDPTDAYVANSVAIEKAWVQHLVSKWGDSTTATGIKYYILDNEPSIWSGTHRDVHPAAESYDELYNDIVAYAGAIRAVDPNAVIVGPEEWSWWAMYESGLDQKNGTGAGSDYATHSNTYYYPYLLQKLYAYKQANGVDLINILSVHCYTDAGSNYNVATRELWDPNYVDPNWYGQVGLNGSVIEWIPLMKQWVNQYYPGLGIACTEYNWDDESTLSGATTEADLLGIFGYYGYDMANIFGAPVKPTYLSMQMYRNYDGNLSTFGDTSVSTTVANPDNLSSYAAVRSSDGALTVMVINKQTGSTPVTVSLANFSTTGSAQAYQVSSAAQTSITSLGSVTVANNSLGATVPSQSVTLFVIPSGSVETAPLAPTGLAAAVGNNTVTLTWNAGGGATSYTVSRGASSTGSFAPIGTVTSPAPTTFADTKVTNGTTYYYVVSGTNSKGTGPNSASVAATPQLPPAFTSSATASPNPVTQNSGTTITATVKCTANTLSNGTVQIIALDPNNNVALTKSFTAQSFATNQTQTYTAALTPTVAGTYTVEVGEFSATGQQWNLNTSAGTITVNSALSFTASATPNPASIAVSSSSSITVKVKDTGTIGLTNGIVQMLILDPTSNQIVQQNWTGQTFTAGGTLTLTYTFNPSSLSPAETTNGVYTFEIGVFNSTWSTDYYWNSSAGSITLTGGSGPPAFTATGTAKPTSIAASGSSTVTFSVQDTGGPLSNANVEIQIYNAANTAVGTQVYSGQNFAANGTLSYTYTWTPSGQSPAVTATGAYTAEVGVFDSGWGTDYYWNSNLATINIAASAAPQTITFPAIATPQVALTGVSLIATSSSGLAVSYASTTPTYCTVSGSIAMPILASGTCTIEATQAGNSNYLPATPVYRSFWVDHAPQTITFPAIATQVALTSVGLTASASSGLTISYASTAPTVCTVSGATASSLISGNCIIQATQPGNGVYGPAPAVSRAYWVNHAPQTITFPTIPTQVVLTSVGLTATASSGLTVVYTSTTPTVCSVAGALASSLISGSCTIEATQAGNTLYSAAPAVYRSYWVNHATQTITFPSVPTQVALTSVGLTATASSGLAVTYTSTTPTVCTVSGATASSLVSGTCTIEATQAGNGAYGPATPVSRSFWVNHAAQTIAFPNPGPQTGVSSLTLTATASSSLTVTFASTTPTVCTVAPGANTASLLINGTCTIQATQAGNTAYGPAPAVSQSFTVSAP